MACAICEVRKEKRFCPAVHGRICPTCCGREREVTLDCPSECTYLQQARANELPRRAEDVDQSTLYPEVELSDSFIYEREPLIVGLSFALAKSAKADRNLHDRDLLAALDTLAKTYTTLVSSGLILGDRSPNIVQQAVVDEVQKMVSEYRELEQKHLGYPTLRDSEILKAVVFLLRMGMARTSGRPKSRAYIDFFFQQFPEKEGVIASPQESGSRLIVP